MDTLTKSERSIRMSLIKNRGTKPELRVEDLLRKIDKNFVKQAKNIPGTPDFSYPEKKKAIYVHGCFWHRHAACRNGQRLPKSRLDFWKEKLHNNRRRDVRKLRQLNRLGWKYIVIWECKLSDRNQLEARLRRFVLGGKN